MKSSGLRRATMAVAMVVLAHVAMAQQGEPTIPAPTILTVTPGNGQAVIGFAAPRNSDLPIESFLVNCAQPGNTRAGILEFPVAPENGNLATIPGLTNGNQYQCTMTARAVTEGLIPRAIDSEPSNPTPVFIPSVAPQDTIFVTPDASAQQQPQQQQPQQQQPAQEKKEAETPAPKTAPGAPVVTESSVNGDTVSVAFKPAPTTANTAAVTGYTVKCESSDAVTASSPAATPVELPARATAAVVSGLEPGNYVCSIVAESRVGPSPATTFEAVIKATPTPPVEPVVEEKKVEEEKKTETSESKPKTETTQTEPKTETTQTEPKTEVTEPVEEKAQEVEEEKDSALRATATAAMLLATAAAFIFA